MIWITSLINLEDHLYYAMFYPATMSVGIKMNFTCECIDVDHQYDEQKTC